MTDVGFTHIALSVAKLEASIEFYARYANFEVVHSREGVVWLSDRTRPFVLVLLDNVRAERVYAPWPDLEHELRARDLPLVSLESWTPLKEFDCVGPIFSHSHH